MVDRPAWTEVIGVLVGCALVLLVLVRLDAAGARNAGARPAPVAAPQAQRPSPRRAADELLLVLAGSGLALTAGGLTVLSRRRSA